MLNSDIREIKSYSLFRKTLLTSITPIANSIYNVHDSYGIKLLTRLRLGFSHRNEHKFRHNFRDTLNPLCSCMNEPGTTSHFLLHCCNFDNSRTILRNDLSYIDNSILFLTERNLTNLLLFGSKKWCPEKCPREKCPPEKSPPEKCPPEIYPRGKKPPPPKKKK